MPSEPSIILSYSETGRQQALGHVESWLRGRCACGHCGGPERAGTGLVLVSCASGVLGSSCTISIQLWEEKRLGRICAAKVKVRASANAKWQVEVQVASLDTSTVSIFIRENV